MKQPTRKTPKANAQKKRPIRRDYLGRLDIGSEYTPEFEFDLAQAMRNVVEHEAWAASLFTDEKIGNIAAKFNIAGDARKAALTGFLRESARFYRDHKNYINGAPTIIEYRQRFQKVKAAAIELKSALVSLSDEERTVLWEPLQGWTPSYFDERTGETNAIPNHISAFSKDGAPVVISPPKGLVMEAPGIIASFADKALDRLPDDTGGRPTTSPPLVLWISSAKGFFEKGLDRNFTFDSHKGVGITPAFNFCCAVLEILDPTVDQTSIGTAMRSVIGSARQKVRRKPTRKNLKQ